jgi:methylated-DNA-[protein]-cysteine S-methyltransferase
VIEIYTENLNNTWFAIALNQQQITASSFGADQKTALNNIFRNLPFNMAFQVFHEPVTYAKNVLLILRCIYEGKEVKATPPLAMSHFPAYTEKVLKTTLTIPLGYVTSYGSIAKTVGGGPRAVGNIMASNPFAPIVPCHRVVKSDFTLGGYGFGLKAKAELLRKEKRGFSDMKKIIVNCGKLTVYPVENVLRNFD